MKKKGLAMLLVAAMTLSMGSSVYAADKADDQKELSITVSGVNGSVNFTPIYVAMEQGFFDDAKLDVDYVLFDNGPVQMEALASDSWDLGFTGVGGVLSGLISYDAKLVGATNTDNGTQTVWARNDSDIVKAGAGHNTVNDQIIGDADSWKGKTVLCNSGTVLEYLLIKTLGGFGLTTDDVQVITMDAPTANSAFQAGQGDVSVITGAISFAEDKKDYTEVSCGNWADTGLECSIIANTASYEDEETYEAMTRFLKVYWETIDWMKENPEDAAQLCSDFNAECGITLEPETASLYMEQDPYYAADEVLKSMTTTSEAGDYSVMEEKLLGILDFFIETGKYNAGDDEKMLNHMDTTLLLSILGIFIFLLIWQLAVEFGLVNETRLPKPTTILQTLGYKIYNQAPDGNTLGINILASLQVALTGFLTAMVIGIPLGLFMGWWEYADRFIRPIFELVRPVPPIAWIPLVVVWMGIGLKAKAMIIFFTAFVPCVINSYTGIKLTNKTLINVSRTFGASNVEIFWKVGIPSALPMVFAGIRVALGNSWSTLVAAEMLAASAGLGYMIQIGRTIARPDIVIAGMVTIGAIGAVLSGILSYVEQHALRWQSKN